MQRIGARPALGGAAHLSSKCSAFQRCNGAARDWVRWPWILLAQSGAMVLIIIPAHNEETVITRNLRAILAGAEPGDLEVIVACNTCRDVRAEIARRFDPPLRLLEFQTASADPST